MANVQKAPNKTFLKKTNISTFPQTRWKLFLFQKSARSLTLERSEISDLRNFRRLTLDSSNFLRREAFWFILCVKICNFTWRTRYIRCAMISSTLKSNFLHFSCSFANFLSAVTPVRKSTFGGSEYNELTKLEISTSPAKSQNQITRI